MSIRFAAARRRLLQAAAAGLWGSGAVWLVAHYLLRREGEFGPEASPLEPWSLAVHGGFAMAALWYLGLLWGVHVVPGWPQRRGRRTGGTLLGLLWLLTVTGWLLYYGSEGVQGVSAPVHWIVGLAVLPLFLWHRYGRKLPVRPRGRSAVRRPGEPGPRGPSR